MTASLTTMLRDSYMTLDEDQAVLSAEEIMHLAGTVRPIPLDEVGTANSDPRSWRRPVMVMALAAAVVAIALVPLLLSGIGADESPATESSTTTTIESSSPTTVPQADAVPPPPIEEAAPPAALPAQMLEDPFDLPRATALGWTWQEHDALPSGPTPLRSGIYVRVDKGWECYDDGYFLTQTENGCADPVEDPIEAVFVSRDGESWTPGSLPPSVGTTLGYSFQAWGLHFTNWDSWWATADGEAWFEPTLDGGPLPGLPLESQSVVVGDRILGAFRSGSDISYAVSGDGGRSFTTEGVPSAIFDQPHTLYERNGGAEVVVWSGLSEDGRDFGDATLWRSNDLVEWRVVGQVAGLPNLTVDLDADKDLNPVEPGEGLAGDPRFGSLTQPIVSITELASGDLLAAGTVLGPSTQSSWGPEHFSYFAVSPDGLSWSSTESVRPVRGEMRPDLSANVQGWFTIRFEECTQTSEFCESGTIGTADGVTWVRFIGPDDRRLTVYPTDDGVFGAVYITERLADGGTSSQAGDERYLATPPTR